MTGPTIGLFSGNAHACADPAMAATRIAAPAEKPAGPDVLGRGRPTIGLFSGNAHACADPAVAAARIAVPAEEPAGPDVLGGGRRIAMPGLLLSEVELVEFVRANAPGELGAEGSA